MVLKLSIRTSASPRPEQSDLASGTDHVVLKLSTRTSALPWRQRSHRGLRVTQHAYFSLLTHTKQLLLVTFCDTLAGIEVSFWADGTGRNGNRTEREPDGQTDMEVKIVI